MTAQIKCQVCDAWVDAFNPKGHHCKGRAKDPLADLQHPNPERINEKLLEKLDHTEQLWRDSEFRYKEFQDFLLDEKLMDRFVTWKVTKRLEGREVC